MNIIVKKIIDTVCAEEGIMPVMLNLKTRKREIVQARQRCMYFAKEYTKLSLETIGSEIGGKDHVTVLHACKTVNNLIFSDRKYRDEIMLLRFKLMPMASKYNRIAEKKRRVKKGLKDQLIYRIRDVNAYSNIINVRIALNEIRSELLYLNFSI